MRRQCAKVEKQFLCVRERMFLRRFQPAELAQIRNVGGLERQHDLSKIESLDFRQFLSRSFPMFALAPEPNTSARGGAAGATGTLLR